MFYKLIEKKRNEWLASDDCTMRLRAYQEMEPQDREMPEMRWENGKDGFGHNGGLEGYVLRKICCPECGSEDVTMFDVGY
jgi:hypothetical protein